MNSLIQKIINFFKNNLLLLVLGLYLLVTLPALLDHNHFFKNLEPYPDGLLYAQSGGNYLQGKQLGLVSPYGELVNWVPPIYTITLGIGSFIFPKTISFYITNIIINLASIFVLYWILNKTTKSLKAKALGLFAYISHSIFFWLPSSPITENITVFFLLLMISSYFIKSWKKYIVLIIGVFGLLLSRYSVFPFVIGGILIPILILFNKSNKSKKILIISLSTLLLIISFWFLDFQKVNVVGFINSVINNNSQWFGSRFIVPNFLSYIKMLTSSKGLFLWFDIGLTNFILFGLFLISLVKLYLNKKFTKFIILLTLFLAQFPLQLVFYVADARYFIYTIPLIILGISWLVDIDFKHKNVVLYLTVIGIILQLFLQRNFIRQIVADNFFMSSTAWQFESIQQFNSILKDGDLIITALPPFLVDYYQTTSYRPLPLSYTQEFMNKKQHVWGNGIDYGNLLETYDRFLNEGKTIYISNAYITHHSDVISDYEILKNNFKFELIKEGCLNACNIYKLEVINND